MKSFYEQMQLNDKALCPYIDEEKLSYLLSLKSMKSITKTLEFYSHKKRINLTNYIKKKGKQISGEKYKEEVRKERDENEHINYGLGQNTMLLKVLDRTMDKWNDYR